MFWIPAYPSDVSTRSKGTGMMNTNRKGDFVLGLILDFPRLDGHEMQNPLCPILCPSKVGINGLIRLYGINGLYGKGLKTVKKGKPATFQGLTEFLCFALSRR